MTVPFRDVKSQMEAVEADEVVVRKADIPDALSSLHGSDTLDKDSYVIDESELTIAVDSKGHPIRLGKGSFGEVLVFCLHWKIQGWYNLRGLRNPRAAVHACL